MGSSFKLYRLSLTVEMSEALQKLIVDTLDLHESIYDTRSLVFPGQAQSASTSEDQIIILGALKSLLSREVNLPVYVLSCHLLHPR